MRVKPVFVCDVGYAQQIQLLLQSIACDINRE